MENPTRLADLLYGTDNLAEDRTNRDEQYNSADSTGHSLTEESLEGDEDDNTSNSGTAGQLDYEEDNVNEKGPSDESRFSNNGEKGNFPQRALATKPRKSTAFLDYYLEIKLKRQVEIFWEISKFSGYHAAQIAPKTDADCWGRGRRRPAPAPTEAPAPPDDGKKINIFFAF